MIYRLTLREQQVLSSLANGNTIAQAAMSLNISARTAREYTDRAKCRLMAKTLCQAVARAVAAGLIDPEEIS